MLSKLSITPFSSSSSSSHNIFFLNCRKAVILALELVKILYLQLLDFSERREVKPLHTQKAPVAAQCLHSFIVKLSNFDNLLFALFLSAGLKTKSLSCSFMPSCCTINILPNLWLVDVFLIFCLLLCFNYSFLLIYL